MWNALRVGLAVVLACLPLGLVTGLATGPATGLPLAAPAAAAAPTVQALTVFPQVGGELTLLGSATGDPAPAPADVAVERWVSDPGWTPVDATASLLDDGRLAVTVPLDHGPMAVAGGAWVRLVVSDPAGAASQASDGLGIHVFADAAPPFTAAPVPTVTGDLTVGSVLHAATGTWSPTPATIGLEWNRDGVRTSVSGSSYPLTGADLGHVITVSATAFPSSGSTSSFVVRDSRPAGAVREGAFVAPPPTVVGLPRLGEEVRVDLDGWRPTPTTLAYQWSRDGVPLADATGSSYTLTAADAGTSLTVAVHAEADGVAPVDRTTTPYAVPADLHPRGPRLAELMKPSSTTPLTTSQVRIGVTTTRPAWNDLRRRWWYDKTAFTHAARPVPFLTLASAKYGTDMANASQGGEYDGTNATLKNVDVTFTITARRFAIAFRGTRKHDAMVWLNGRPVAARPLRAQSSGDTSYRLNWVVVTLPARATTRVRFAGPLTFTGVDTAGADRAVVKATPPPFTVGVVSDSMLDQCAQAVCMSRAAVPTLGRMTGWRVWNLAEGGTGYRSNSSAPSYGTFVSSRFGSDRRLAAVARAPLDLLLVNGSFNDAPLSTYSAEAHKAAVDRYLDDLARIRPDLPVVLVGIEPLGRYQTTYWDSRSRTMNATLAATVGRHPNVIGFIDPYTDRWLTGTGSIAAPKGDGNQDVYVGTDGVHLSVAGVGYYVGRIVTGLREVRLP
ncbi:MAG TPA: hypothetical protein VM575_18215 [Nocardioides sp.]|nr:hypothetical protein [Nocardioides sp.]